MGVTEQRTIASRTTSQVLTAAYGLVLGDKVGAQLGGFVGSTGQVWLSSPRLGTREDFSSLLVTNYDPALKWTDFQTGFFSLASGSANDAFLARNSLGQWWLTDSSGLYYVGAWNPLETWSDVQVANIDDDIFLEIIGRTKSGQWWVADTNGTDRTFTNKFLGTWSAAANWTDVRVGDYNGDGVDDIAGRVGSTGQWWFSLMLNQTLFNVFAGAWSPAVQWADVRVGDFNGDGRSDLAGRANGQWWVSISTGSLLTTSLWTNWSTAVTWTDVLVYDYNGDGKDDIVGRIQGTGTFWSATSVGSAFLNVNTLNLGGTSWGQTLIVDINGDRRSDLLTRDPRTGIWMAAVSDGKRLKSFRYGVWSSAVSWTYAGTGFYNG